MSRGGFYDWAGRKPSRRAQEDERLKAAIKAAHKRAGESYSARRLQPELGAEGFVAGRDRIARLRRELGLRCRQKRKFKATTNSNHNLPVAENLLKQTFTPSAPHEVWVADITYIPTGEGWLYPAGVKDVFTCEIVGYAMAERMTQNLVGRALFRAAQQKRPAPGLIHHSDRGITAQVYNRYSYAKEIEVALEMLAGKVREGLAADLAQGVVVLAEYKGKKMTVATNG